MFMFAIRIGSFALCILAPYQQDPMLKEHTQLMNKGGGAIFFMRNQNHATPPSRVNKIILIHYLCTLPYSIKTFHVDYDFIFLL